MWHCPRCVAHVKDERATCPECGHARPEQEPGRLEEHSADVHDLIPNLGARNVSQNPYAHPRRDFLIGFAIGLPAAMIWYATTVRPREFDAFTLWFMGAMFGVFGGVISLVCLPRLLSAFRGNGEAQRPETGPLAPTREERVLAEKFWRGFWFGFVALLLIALIDGTRKWEHPVDALRTLLKGVVAGVVIGGMTGFCWMALGGLLEKVLSSGRPDSADRDPDELRDSPHEVHEERTKLDATPSDMQKNDDSPNGPSDSIRPA
jgi:hypothetical protein